MKAVSLTIEAGEAHKENYNNSCYFKNPGQSDLIFGMQIPGTWVHFCVKYETFMI